MYLYYILHTVSLSLALTQVALTQVALTQVAYTASPHSGQATGMSLPGGNFPGVLAFYMERKECQKKLVVTRTV